MTQEKIIEKPNQNPNRIKDPDRPGIERALRRAAKRARQIAYQTKTHIVIWENGKVVKKRVTDDLKLV